MLSLVLSGDKTYAEIVTHADAWCCVRGIKTRFGEHVTRVDHNRKCVTSTSGETPYDDLIIVPGSAPFIISLAGKDLPGVVTCRALEDTNAMIAAVEPGAKAVAIRGGLLGLEAAAGMQVRGVEVLVIHIMGHLKERQLDPAAGCLQQKSREARGMRIHCKGATKAIPGTDRVEAVLLEDGTVYDADIGCMAAGTRPVGAAGDRRASGDRLGHHGERPDADLGPGDLGCGRMPRT